jgi:anti-sigma factor RsiW
VDCNSAKASIFPYVDGELEAADRAGLEAHVAACGTCARLLARERAFQAAYVRPLRPTPAPEPVRRRVIRQLAELAARSGPARRPARTRLALAACAIGLVALGAAGTLVVETALRTSTALADLVDAAVDQHQKLSRDLLPADISGVTPRDAEDWFRKRLAFNMTVPELVNERLTFLGGRITHLLGAEAAALAYQVDGSDVSLFVVPGEAYRNLKLKEPPRFKLVTRRGYDVIVWQSHARGIGYALVSEIGGRSCLVCHASDEVRESAASLSAHR